MILSGVLGADEIDFDYNLSIVPYQLSPDEAHQRYL
jgi:hypothetical protein